MRLTIQEAEMRLYDYALSSIDEANSEKQRDEYRRDAETLVKSIAHIKDLFNEALEDITTISNLLVLLETGGGAMTTMPQKISGMKCDRSTVILVGLMQLG